MAILTSLPVEILTQIFSNLATTDLAHISELSHHLHDVVQPIIFKDISLVTSEYTYHVNFAATASLKLFLRTFLSPRYKAQHGSVRHLTLQWGQLPKNWPTVSDTDDPSDLAVTRRVQPEQISMVCAEFGLLLHFLPRLHTLHLTSLDEITTFDHFMENQFDYPRRINATALQTLEVFRCTADVFAGVRPKTLLILLTLPRIQIIETPLEEYREFTETSPAPASTIKALGLTCPQSMPDHMEVLFSRAPMLQQLLFCTSGPDISLVKVGTALAPLRASLETLQLQLTYDKSSDNNDADFEDGPEPHTIGSFRDWPKLTTIRCTFMALLGRELRENTPLLANVLPVGIHRLEILYDRYWARGEVLHQLLQLIQYHELVPQLGIVAVNMKGRKNKHKRMWKKLDDECKLKGVVLLESGRLK